MKLLGYLEQFLDRDKGTVIAIANDGYIVENVAEWILELACLYPCTRRVTN